MSSDKYFGGVFDKNDAYLDIYTQTAFNNGEEPLFSVVIPAGTYMTFDSADNDN